MRIHVNAAASNVAGPRSVINIAGIAVALGIVMGAVPVAAQSSAGARARVDADVIPSFYAKPTPGATGCQSADAGTSSAAATTGCAPIGGSTGSASASFTNGVLRSDAQLVLNNAQLVGTGTPGAELMATSRVDFSDRVTFSTPANVTLTHYSFSVGWSGTLVEPISLAPGVSSFVQGALLFLGSGGPTTPIGWTGITRWFSGATSVVQEQGGTFAGNLDQQVVNGSRITSISGISTFNGLLTSNTLDFVFTHYSDAAVVNNSGLTQLVSGEVRSDFSNSAAITGLRLFSGNQDVTNQVQYTFASGLILPTAVPEPSTILLLLAGLCAGGMAVTLRRQRT